MPDIFISHSTKDRVMAHQVQQYLLANGASAFFAPFSVQPGVKWSSSILENLRNAKIVLFLASRAACASPYVNQELGSSMALSKKIVPVIWDMGPESLPGWMKEYQCVDLRQGFHGLRPLLDSIVKDLNLAKNKEGFLLVAAIIGLLALLSKD